MVIEVKRSQLKAALDRVYQRENEVSGENAKLIKGQLEMSTILIIIGTLSNVRYFGRPPIPPNYTTISSITWDLPGNYGLIFRLNYYGSSPIKIIHLLFC